MMRVRGNGGVLPGLRQPLVITDIDMSIWEMCQFTVKWVVAAIPAAVVLWLMMLGLGMGVAFLFRGAVVGVALR